MSDPLKHALDALGRAVEERGALQKRLNDTLVENQQITRRFENARDRADKMESRIASLELALENAQQRKSDSERATRDHLARVA